MTARGATLRPRGGPLVMLALLLAGWSAARAVLWENPFARIGAGLDLPQATRARPDPVTTADQTAQEQAQAQERLRVPSRMPLALPFAAPGWTSGSGFSARLDPQLAAAHQLVWFAALRESSGHEPLAGDRRSSGANPALLAGEASWPGGAPFLPASAAGPATAAGGRWSANAWAFWRQGSDAAPVPQGRVPTYGASQAGAVLQYRLAPASPHDPRLYARAYRALVERGESELALGASARPIARVPARLAGELRYTDGAVSNALRPAAYAVTELPPFALAHGVQLEAYGQAGWVGGPSATAFVDGQASVTRELHQIAGLTDNRVRFSLGAAAWGGAQEDAQRVDIGPTMRLDLTVGEVPARLSVDWRERVGGDASPGSGLAATLSTQF
jgi:hypothetical protein